MLRRSTRKQTADDVLWAAGDALAAGGQDGARSYLNNMRRRSGLNSLDAVQQRNLMLQQQQNIRRKESARSPPRRTAPLGPPPGRTGDIDWETRPMSPPGTAARIFDKLAGPGGTGWEITLTALALVGTCVVAHFSALPFASTVETAAAHSEGLRGRKKKTSSTLTFTTLQYALSMLLAIIDGSAAVQTATGQSKRHYHGPSGRLGGKIACIIAAEAVAQAALIGYAFTEGPEQAKAFALRSSAWLSVCLLLLYFVPLHAQRPLSVLLLLASVFLGNTVLLPPTPGMDWIRLVLPVKYLLSHPVRHEPYVYKVRD